MAESKTTLLVVEDEIPILRFLRTSLQASGFGVLEARDGRLAIELAAKRKPDVILLDLGLPDMDGIALIRALRASADPPPIIVASGLDSGATRRAGRSVETQRGRDRRAALRAAH